MTFDEQLLRKKKTLANYLHLREDTRNGEIIYYLISRGGKFVYKQIKREPALGVLLIELAAFPLVPYILPGAGSGTTYVFRRAWKNTVKNSGK